MSGFPLPDDGVIDGQTVGPPPAMAGEESGLEAGSDGCSRD